MGMDYYTCNLCLYNFHEDYITYDSELSLTLCHKCRCNKYNLENVNMTIEKLKSHIYKLELLKSHINK